MSQIPPASPLPPASSTPPPPPLPQGGQPGYDATIPYLSPGQKTSGMAIAAMVLGIVAIPLMCILGIGILPAIVAITLGIISLVSINKAPQRLGGKGYAIAGIVIGGCAFFVLPLAIAILLPSMGRAREMANRGTCEANLRGLVQSMNVYGASENDLFPVLPYAPHSPANAGTATSSTTGGTVDAVVTTMYGPSYPQRGAPLGGPWLLAMRGDVSVKQFLCKSDPHAKNMAYTAAPGGAFFTNFQADDQLSYSFAYPYTRAGEVGGWWKATADASVPIAADMNPKAGTGKPSRTPAVPTSGKAANSNNHQGEGQVVAFSDAHAEFVRRPDVGQNNDNIYTIGGGGGSPTGTPPTSGPINVDGAPGAYDIVVVPVRNLDTGRLW